VFLDRYADDLSITNHQFADINTHTSEL